VHFSSGVLTRFDDSLPSLRGHLLLLLRRGDVRLKVKSKVLVLRIGHDGPPKNHLQLKRILIIFLLAQIQMCH
jgi:hypothetical protein